MQASDPGTDQNDITSVNASNVVTSEANTHTLNNMSANTNAVWYANINIQHAACADIRVW